MNVQKAIRELERLGYTVVAPGAGTPGGGGASKSSNPTAFSNHTPGQQEAMRRAINNGLW